MTVDRSKRAEARKWNSLTIMVSKRDTRINSSRATETQTKVRSLFFPVAVARNDDEFNLEVLCDYLLNVLKYVFHAV